MSVTDLTNTTWILNNDLHSATYIGIKNIFFVSNNSNFARIDTDEIESDGILVYGFAGSNTEVYNVFSGGWTNQAYRTIKITGGTDVSNTELINWLVTNATQLVVSDLTNTTWVLNSSINLTSDVFGSIAFSGNGTFYSDGISINGTFSYLDEDNGGLEVTGSFDKLACYITKTSEGVWGIVLVAMLNNAQVQGGYFTNGYYLGSSISPNPYTYSVNQSLDVDIEDLTFTFTGGTDVTNTNLILWLQNNATQQEIPTPPPTPTSTGKIGDLPIIKKHFGSLEIIKEVLNGSVIYESSPQEEYNYEFQNGVLTINDAPYTINDGILNIGE